MGNLLSMSSEPPAERKRILGAADNTKSPITTNTEPLFLDEVKAEPATWSEESLCRTIQRFFGLLPDSPAMIIVPDVSSLMPRRGSIAVYRPEALGEDTPSLSEDSRKVPVQDQEAHEMADSVRADAKAIEHFYQTRFDDSPDSARPSRAMEARH
ncbi:hypothetical protein AM588_10008217 [Phytophthora nicotianae]|uniref:Uncharacterized protein n=1 Tax=Phytophthora nicotianae TaxID=4792 RepID=A0A0W8D391_PHYNI|nr:hypothetical protein AM588_10008217 [Phytophthora nicotianae]